MDFWNLMVKKDSFICKGLDNMLYIKSLFNFPNQKILRSMKHPQYGINRNAFVILNGPSLAKQNLLSIKSDLDFVFVNRGFKHPDYKALKPKYHVFVDSKMLSGEWPLTWLDEIYEMVPDIIFVMPVSWASLPQFKPYIEKKYRFYWIEDFKKCYCVGVSGACFDFLEKIGYKTIYFTGFDANGLPLEMINNSNSHFYGVNEENLLKTTKDYVRDLYMFSRHYNDLNNLAVGLKKRNIKVINVTEGGLLDMFERIEIDKI